MSNPKAGKLKPSRTARLLEGAGGAPSKSVILGPGPGLDAAVLDMHDGRVMVIAEDPIFPAPGLPLEIFGWFTVHIGASDVAVTGVRPEFMTYSLLLPPEFPEKEVKIIIDSIGDAAKDLGICIAGGHTGWYPAVTVPTIGGVTVWGYAPSDKWISPGGSREGDLVLMTKGPAIEAAALLAVLYREKLSRSVKPGLLEAACDRTSQITVVKDALTAFSCGGVHAMHDATEGGVLGGLWEMSASSGLPVHADLDAVPVPDDIAAVAHALKFDPWAAISEGTLLMAVSPGSEKEIMRVLNETGIDCWKLGEILDEGKASGIKRGGEEQKLTEPEADPFWDLFFKGVT
jgi:hydrogenase expression/formation protein HypE